MKRFYCCVSQAHENEANLVRLSLRCHSCLLLFVRNVYNEWALCVKNAGDDEAPECDERRIKSMSICPDEWVSLSGRILRLGRGLE